MINLTYFKIEITREIGENNIFLFGNLAEDVEELRHRHFYGDFQLDPQLEKVFAAIKGNMFGEAADFSALTASIEEHGDYYLVSDDFNSYITTHGMVDEAFKNKEEWLAKSITSVARMGFFSTDRVINEYADSIWNVEPLAVKD
jgi:starch phosphorylase